MIDEKAKSTVTPIKKASKHQKLAEAPTTKLEKRKLKTYDTNFNGRDQVIHHDEETGEIIIDGKVYNVDLEFEDGYFLANVEDAHKYKIEYQSGNIYLEGRRVEFNFNPSIPKLERKKSKKAGQTIINAPLPGNVTEIFVREGDKVEMGDTVCTLEAMKMQNDIVTDNPGIVESVYVKQGDLVTSDQRLVMIKEDKDKENDE